MKPRFRHGLFAAVFFLAAAAALYGRGTQDDSSLARADKLIADKEYDEAIDVLRVFIAENPERFREAHTRLQKIGQLRDMYNTIANELLDTLESEPENGEKILELSNRLTAIESSANPQTSRFLDMVYHLAELNVNRNRLERALLAGREQLEAANYSRALAAYASGLDIYRDDYFSSGYGREAEELASRGIETINQNIRAFDTLAPVFSGAARELAGMNGEAGAPGGGTEAAYARLPPLMEELANLRKSFAGIREAFAGQLALQQAADSSLGDRSFLAFANILINGPPSGQTEGMAGTLERFWNHYVDPAESSLIAAAGRSYSAGFSATENRDYPAAVSAFDETRQSIAAALGLIRGGDSFFGGADGRVYTLYGETVREEKAADYLALRIMDSARDFLGRAGDLRQEAPADADVESAETPLASWRRGLMEPSEAMTLEQERRAAYESLISRAGALAAEARAGTETALGYRETLDALPGYSETPQSYLEDARNVIVRLGEDLRAQDYNAAVRYYTIANGDFEKRVNVQEAEFNEGNRLVQGVTEQPEGSEPYLAHYPAEGLAVLENMAQSLREDIDGARALTGRYAAEPGETLGRPGLSALDSAAREMLNRLLALETQSAGVMAAARTQIQRAESFRSEGDRLLRAAEAALAQNNFGTARNNLGRAGEQYGASRAIQESAFLRDFWNTQLVSLGEEIVRIENEVVVRDVRALVTAARNLYFQGNMDEAESNLISAQSRWRATNSTEQPEVEYWLGLVRGAQSLQSGRTIAQTAPLYAEMSQLLSDAQRNYDEGVRFLNAGRRGDGLARFGTAREKTREVRLMFPLNQDARMLELRIEQQTDVSAFNASFRQRLNEAVAGTRPAARNLQSYADLQDLARINPRYPGIRAVLDQAEIDMGFRPPPPDPRDLARSTELARNAGVNINSRDTIRYEMALTQLQEAIRLNPNNTQAQQLLDQVSILLRGTGTIVISYNDQIRYDEAVQMFNQGNYLQANAIVEQLLQNPQNQRSTLILDLKRRIDAILL